MIDIRLLTIQNKAEKQQVVDRKNPRNSPCPENSKEIGRGLIVDQYTANQKARQHKKERNTGAAKSRNCTYNRVFKCIQVMIII